MIDALDRFLQMSWDAKREMGLAGRSKIEKEFDRKIVVELTAEEIRKCENLKPVG